MAFDRSTFVTRTPQEDIAFDYQNNGFIADKVMTLKSVNKASTKVSQFDTSKLRVPNDQAATNSEASTIDEQLFTKDVTLKEYKLGKDVNPRDVRDADVPYMLSEARAIKVVTEQLMLAREKRIAAAVTLSTNYPTALYSAIASGSRWNETNGDPQGDAMTARSAVLTACGKSPNAMAIDSITLNKMRVSPAFREAIKYTNGGPISDEAIKAFFQVNELIVAECFEDTAIQGTTPAKAAIWSTFALLFVKNPSPSLDDVSYGHLYHMNAPFWVNTVEDKKRNGAAGCMRRVEVGTEYTYGPGYTVASSNDDFSAGYLFATVVA